MEGPTAFDRPFFGNGRLKSTSFGEIGLLTFDRPIEPPVAAHRHQLSIWIAGNPGNHPCLPSPFLVFSRAAGITFLFKIVLIPRHAA